MCWELGNRESRGPRQMAAADTVLIVLTTACGHRHRPRGFRVSSVTCHRGLALYQQRSVASFTFHCFALQDQRRKVCSLCGLRPSKGSTHMHIVCPMQKSPFHISHLIIDAGSGRRRVHNTTQSKSCLIISTVCLLSVSVLRPSLSDNKISIQGVQRNCLHLIICSFVGFYSCKLQKVGHF